MQSASIMRTIGQNNIAAFENDTTRMNPKNHPLQYQQQTFHQTNRIMQTGSSIQYEYRHTAGFDAMAFRHNESPMMPMAQMIPGNAFPHQIHHTIDYGNGQRQNHYTNSRHSNVSDSSHSGQKMIQYRGASVDDMSELTDMRIEESQHGKSVPPRCVSMEEDERSSNRRSTFSFIDIEEENNMMSKSPSSRPDRSAGKLRRSTSTRSLSFNDNTDRDKLLLSSNASKMSNGDSSSKEEFEQRAVQFLNQMVSVSELDTDNPVMMRAFLTRPCPKAVGMIKCYIKRNKGIKNKLFPEYRVYLKETNAFLMTSKKRIGNATSNYLISMGRNDFDNRLSPNVIGKLRSNFLGIEYTIYDGGRNPHYENSCDDDADSNARCELGAVFYAASTTLGTKGPRKMKACIGKVDEDNNATKVWQPMSEDDDRMVTCFKDNASSQDNLMSFVNKNPGWNEEIKAYALNFNGRVTMASVKNFQLVDESDPEKIYLQFGRTGKDEFILDLQWPLSPLQAFAFALSSFDSKLGCD